MLIKIGSSQQQNMLLTQLHGSYFDIEAGCEDGWIEGGLCFKGNSSEGDYHGEMNSQMFEKWVSL